MSKERFLQIKGGVVINRIVVDTDLDVSFPDDVLLLPDKAGVDIGWLWNGSSFTASPVDLKAVKKEYDQKLEDFFDETARQRNYRDRVTCFMRAGVPGPWQADGLAFATWMDKCNVLAYAMVAAVEQGAPVPSWDQVIEAMPKLEWPNDAQS